MINKIKTILVGIIVLLNFKNVYGVTNPTDTIKKQPDTLYAKLPKEYGVVFSQNEDIKGQKVRLVTKKDSMYLLFEIDKITRKKKFISNETEPIIDWLLSDKCIIFIADTALIGSPYNMVYFTLENGRYAPIIIIDTITKQDIFLCNKPIRIELYKEDQFLVFTASGEEFLITYTPKWIFQKVKYIAETGELHPRE